MWRVTFTWMSMLGLGANITENSVSRAAKCLHTALEVCDNFDQVNDIPYQSGKHSPASVRDDAKLIIKELHERSKVSVEVPGRMHRQQEKSLWNYRLVKAGLNPKRIISLRFIQKMKKLYMVTMYINNDACITT